MSKNRLEQNKNDIEKKVKTEMKEKLKREARQAKQLQQYLRKVDKTPPLHDEEIIKLWDKLGKTVKERKEEKSRVKKKIFRANLREVVLIAKRMKDKSYIKPYFTFLEIIKEGEKGLWNAIRNYKWPQLGVTHKTSITPYAISRHITETADHKRWKIVTGEDYKGRLDLTSIDYVGHPILDNSSLTFTERIIADEKFRKALKEIRRKTKISEKRPCF